MAPWQLNHAVPRKKRWWSCLPLCLCGRRSQAARLMRFVTWRRLAVKWWQPLGAVGTYWTCEGGDRAAKLNMNFSFISAELMTGLLLLQTELPAVERRSHSCCCLVQHHYGWTVYIVNGLFSFPVLLICMTVFSLYTELCSFCLACRWNRNQPCPDSRWVMPLRTKSLFLLRKRFWLFPP